MVERWALERGCVGNCHLGQWDWRLRHLGSTTGSSRRRCRYYCGHAGSRWGRISGDLGDRIFADVLGLSAVSRFWMCVSASGPMRCSFAGSGCGVPGCIDDVDGEPGGVYRGVDGGMRVRSVMFGNTHQRMDAGRDSRTSTIRMWAATTNVANLGAAGLFATLTVVLVRTLPALPVPAGIAWADT
jgi:hypothetical protein